MKIVGSGSLPTIDEDMIGRDGNEPNRHWLGILLLWFKCNTPDTPAVGPDTPDMEFLVHVIFVLWAPQPLKTISLSLSTHSMSPVTLSPSLPQVPSLSPNPRTQNPLPNQSQDQGGFKSAWRTIFPAYSSPGCLRFQVLRAGTARSRYANLCRPDLSF